MGRAVSKHLRVFKCPICGAPLRVRPGSPLIYCSYCGYWEFSDPGFKTFTLKAIGRDEAINSFLTELRNPKLRVSKVVRERAVVESAKLIYVPYHLVRWRVRYVFKGKVVEYVTTDASVGSHASIRVQRVERPVSTSGILENVSGLIASNSREYGFSGLSELVVKAWRGNALVPSESFDWGSVVEVKGDVLPFDESVEDAVIEGKERAHDEARRSAIFETGATEVTLFGAKVELSEVLASAFMPLWLIKYRVGDVTMSASIDGYSGKVLSLKVPDTITSRLRTALLGTASAFATVMSLALVGFAADLNIDDRLALIPLVLAGAIAWWGHEKVSESVG